MKHIFAVGGIVTLLTLSGCGVGQKNTTPAYMNDVAGYENNGSKIGKSDSAYIPAPAATVETAPSGDGTVSVPLTTEQKNSPTSTYGAVNSQPVAPSPASYTKAINTYKGHGAYFQLVQCHGTPGTISLKARVKFMLDNRDPVSHILRVGTTKYEVAPFGYVVASAPGPGAGRYYITCDGGGAALLNVEE